MKNATLTGKTVYMVIEGCEYEGENANTARVFSTLEKANAYAETLKGPSSDRYAVVSRMVIDSLVAHSVYGG
jgi:hypothetical protein